MELDLTEESIATDRMKLMADMQMAHNQNLVQLEKAQTERLAKKIELVMKTSMIPNSSQDKKF